MKYKTGHNCCGEIKKCFPSSVVRVARQEHHLRGGFNATLQLQQQERNWSRYGAYKAANVQLCKEKSHSKYLHSSWMEYSLVRDILTGANRWYNYTFLCINCYGWNSVFHFCKMLDN